MAGHLREEGGEEERRRCQWSVLGHTPLLHAVDRFLLKRDSCTAAANGAGAVVMLLGYNFDTAGIVVVVVVVVVVECEHYEVLLSPAQPWTCF